MLVYKRDAFYYKHPLTIIIIGIICLYSVFWFFTTSVLICDEFEIFSCCFNLRLCLSLLILLCGRKVEGADEKNEKTKQNVSGQFVHSPATRFIHPWGPSSDRKLASASPTTPADTFLRARGPHEII